uniref:Peptidase S1 domain-containing protein n=1 Tax=Pseudonaja textilis TaxID=8673 RepID=A0A670ZAP5_PSETE
ASSRLVTKKPDVSSLLRIECGQPRNSRIVGGQDATPGKWPWQVSIVRNGRHYCGASIINEQWILSAAHCFYKSKPLQLRESHDLFVMMKKIILHPDFNGKPPSLGDIALIQLEKPVDFTNSIMPICLPTSSENFSTETDCWVTGWGTIKYEVPLPLPLTLQEVKVPLINQNICSGIYNSFPVFGKDAIKDDMICAGYPNSGKDSCQGDSGGPLTCQLQGRWTQAGIVSWGVGCASTTFPGVYTSVPYYSDWIKYVMEENTSNKSNSGNILTQNISTSGVSSQNRSNLLVPLLVVLLLSIGLAVI